MRKLVNSLLYGSSKTKSYLWSMLVLLCIAVAFGILAIGMASFPMGIVSFLSLGLDGVIYQSVSFNDMVKDGEEAAQRHTIETIKKKSKKLQPDHLNALAKKTGDELIDELGINALSSNDLNVTTTDKGAGSEKKQIYLEKYNDKSIKKLMVKYKVKKEHRKVMIDFSEIFRVHQCPAYLWKDRKNVNFLLLEEKPRIIKISMDRIKGIGYAKMVEAKPTNEYQSFMEPCLITKVFSEFLPIYKEGTYLGKRGVYKNLYILTPDIRITSTSARNLFDVIEVEFSVSDDVTNSKSYSEYYKVAYKDNILWKDGVITTNEYKERIKSLLTYVAKEKLSKQVYYDLLEQLSEHKLITKDYASYYRTLKK
ncbi:MAG: hypothetical protein ACERKN_00975 [Velocimicrobium sp.]